MLEAGFDATLRAYMASLDWVMRWQKATLLFALGTLVLTVALYMWIPKGFLPQQDTGVIVATNDAEQDASFQRIAEVQRQAVAIARADRDVVTVTGFSGAGTLAGTGNTVRLTIVLKPPKRARGFRRRHRAPPACRTRRASGRVVSCSPCRTSRSGRAPAARSTSTR